MLTKMRKKGKKGFTLVELIVVIAIIAILAAVAVPTTIHFVEKANISNEQSAINFKSQIDGIFTGAVTPDGAFNLAAANAQADDSLAKLLAVEVKAPVTKITFTVTANGAGDDARYTVKYRIVGTEYKGQSDVTGTVAGDFTKSQIFKGVDTPAAGDYVYTLGADGFTVTAPGAGA